MRAHRACPSISNRAGCWRGALQKGDSNVAFQRSLKRPLETDVLKLNLNERRGEVPELTGLPTTQNSQQLFQLPVAPPGGEPWSQGTRAPRRPELSAGTRDRTSVHSCASCAPNEDTGTSSAMGATVHSNCPVSPGGTFPWFTKRALCACGSGGGQHSGLGSRRGGVHRLRGVWPDAQGFL